jgi:hypothetical protein
MRAAGQWKDCPFGCDKIINPQRGNKCSFDQTQAFVAKAMTDIAMPEWWRVSKSRVAGSAEVPSRCE